MKKISLLGVCLLAGLTMSAQTDLVKEVEREMKGGSPNYQEILKKIQPALTNPETKDKAQTWNLAGKAGFKLYDDAYIKTTLGNQLSNDEKKAAGHGMIDGYKYFFTAIPLDQQPDEKGKVKPKYTKDMLKEMKNNYLALKNAGVLLFEAQDYDGAYDAWEIYCTLPTNPAMGNEAPTAEADTLVGNIMYYQAIAMLSNNEDQRALDKMKQLEKTGYSSLDYYRYAVEAARRVNDSIALIDFAQKGFNKYGTEDISFIGQLINQKLNANDYPACYELVNAAIAGVPDDQTAVKTQLVDILGYIYEQDGKMDEAAANYEKALSLDPNYAKGYFDLGRVIYNRALKLDEEVIDEQVRVEKVNPQLLKAAEYFEKAYSLDEDNMGNIPGILYRLYYRLGPGYEDKAALYQNM